MRNPITLKTLATASEQEVFDQVARHLLTQGCCSKDELGDCLYRNPDGLQCAAGCLIGDDEYLPRMEGWDWDSLADEGFPVPSEHEVLIIRVQRIHDNISPSKWRRRLGVLATELKLSTAVLDEFDA